MRYYSLPLETSLPFGNGDKQAFQAQESSLARACWLLDRLTALCRQSEVELDRIRALQVRCHNQRLIRESLLSLN